MKKKKEKTFQEGVCHLCGCQGKLCEAHIIPKALKHLVAGRGGTFAALEIVPTEESSFTSKPIKAYPTQNLDSDKNILCSECDNEILGVYDKILVNFYKKYIQLSNTSIITDSIYIKIDKRLYFGFLTLLYRASIAKQFVHIPEHYKEIIRFSLFDQTIQNLSDDLRIYFCGHRSDFSSNSIYNIYGCSKEDGQYVYCFPSFGLEVIFLLGNIGRTQLSNVLALGCIYQELTLLNPNQEYVKIHFSTYPSQLTQIQRAIQRPLPPMAKKIRK